MKSSKFYTEKEILKIKITNQERIIQDEINKAINLKQIVPRFIPDFMKNLLGFGKKSKTNPKPSIINIVIEAKKIIEDVFQVVSMIKQVRSQNHVKN